MYYKKRLKSEREDQEILQKDICKIINIDSSQYCHYEKEDDIMPTKHLNTIANYLNVSLDYLFEFTDEKRYDNRIDEINKELSGKRLKEFRKKNNLTQVKLAKVLNTSQSAIAEYERGTNIIATPFLYMICKKYHASADWLLGKVDEVKYLK